MEQQEIMEYVHTLKMRYNASNGEIAERMNLHKSTVATHLKGYEELSGIKWRIIKASGCTEEQYISVFDKGDSITQSIKSTGTYDFANPLIADIKIAAEMCGVSEDEVKSWILRNMDVRNKRMCALTYHIREKYTYRQV